MQKKIEIHEGICKNSLFSVDKFSFKLAEAENGKMIKYSIILNTKGDSPLDIRFLLEETDPELEFILETPEELTNYIKQYEEDKNPEDESLFHDIRTKYIEFIKKDISSDLSADESMILLGFSIVGEKIYIIVKTFSLKLLSAFLEKIKIYCRENEIDFTESEDIRWLELEQYIVRRAEMIREHQSEEFLEKTLVESYFPRFLKIFRKIDRDGYFKKSFYEDVMFQKKTLRNGEEIPVHINQVSKFFSPYWKYVISANNKEILCLHDEMPSDEKIEEYVYSFKPSLLGYYLKNWFEDFTVEVIKRKDFSPYTITHIMPGVRFNFFQDRDEKNIREIDVAISVESKGVSKLIAIECKKTLSDKEIQNTNKKIREKVIESGNNVFDAFVHIGCFSNDVDFDKIFEGTKLKYKHNILKSSEKYLDSPFYAFDVSSREDYENKLAYVIKDIFENW